MQEEKTIEFPSDDAFGIFLTGSPVTNLDAKVGPDPIEPEKDERKNSKELLICDKKRLCTLARGGEKMLLKVLGAECGLDPVNAAVFSQAMTDKYGPTTYVPRLPMVVDSIETLERCMLSVVKVVNKHQRKKVWFRDKDERSKNNIHSDCCTFPLPFRQTEQNKDKLSNMVKQNITKNMYRESTIGVFGSVGAGKSSYVDYVCNEDNAVKVNYYTIPISLNDSMRLQFSEKEVGNDHTTVIDVQRVIGARLVFAYFLDKREKINTNNNNNNNNNNGNEEKSEAESGKKRHQRVSSWHGTCFKAFIAEINDLRVYDINWEKVINAIVNEVKQLKLEMLLLVDDVSGGLRVCTQNNPDYITSVVAQLGQFGFLILVVLTFDDAPNKFVSAASCNLCILKDGHLHGVDLTNEMLEELNGRRKLGFDKEMMKKLFRYFGINTRCFSVLFYSLFEKDENELVIFKPLSEDFVKYCQNGKLGNALEEFIGLWTVGLGNTGEIEDNCQKYEKELLFTLCLMVFNIFEKQFNPENEELKTNINAMKSFGFLFTSKHDDVIVRVSPLLIKLWMLKADRNDPMCESFRNVLSMLFDKLEKREQWAGSDFEDLARTLVLLRVNCGKYLNDKCGDYLNDNKQTRKKFSTLGGLLGIDGPDGELELDFERIKWEDLSKEKRFKNPNDEQKHHDPCDWFAGITDLDNCKPSKKITKSQMDFVGLLAFHSKNLNFDIWLRLYVQDMKYPFNVYIEVKGNADDLGTPLCVKKKRSVIDVIFPQNTKFYQKLDEVVGLFETTEDSGSESEASSLKSQSHYLGYLFWTGTPFDNDELESHSTVQVNVLGKLVSDIYLANFMKNAR